MKLLYKPSQWKVAADPAEHDRRSIYLIAKRNLRLPFLEVFDAPALLDQLRAARVEHPRAPGARAAQRPAVQRARRRVRRPAESGDRRRSPELVVDRAFRLALGRPPTPQERELSLEFLRDQPLEEFALAVFNLNGFLYVP